MKKILMLFLLFSSSFFGVLILNAEEQDLKKTEKEKKSLSSLAYQSSISLQVINVEKVQANIIEYLQTNKGYFTNKSNSYIQIKIDPKNLLAFFEYLKGQGILISKNVYSKNHSLTIKNLKATITTMQNTISEYLKIIDAADFYSTLDIEKKLLRAVYSLERAKGKLRYYEEHIRFAYITVSFKAYSSKSIQNSSSPFNWVNNLSLNNLFRGF